MEYAESPIVVIFVFGDIAERIGDALQQAMSPFKGRCRGSAGAIIGGACQEVTGERVVRADGYVSPPARKIADLFRDFVELSIVRVLPFVAIRVMLRDYIGHCTNSTLH